MMIRVHFWWGSFLALVAVPALLFADADTRSVQAQFDRCGSLVERHSRLVRDYEYAVAALRVSGERMHTGSRETYLSQVGAMGGRVESARGRLERSGGQADRIRSQLAAVAGPSCPSCVVSAVNMYCRTADMLESELDDIGNSIRELEEQLGAQGGAPALHEAVGDVVQIDDLVREQGERLNACPDETAAALWQQGLLSASRGDSLAKADDAQGARQSYTVARTLLLRAVAQCPAP